MKNPHTCQRCGNEKISIIDSRMQQDNLAKKRRIICKQCDHRWSTFEITQERYESLSKIRDVWNKMQSASNAISAAIEGVKLDADQ